MENNYDGNTPRWNELPPELLEYIFESCIEIGELASEKISQQSKLMLNCRLVSTTWKASVDKVLERKSLENLTTWNPRKMTANPLFFSNLPIFFTNRTSPTLESTACLPTIYSGTHVGCPFPTKSLSLHCTDTRRFKGGHPVIRVDTFFVKTGHYLNSLKISKLVVAADILGSILRSLSNLKTLCIDNITVEFRHENDPVALPLLDPFEKLTHLQLYEIKDEDDVADLSHQTRNWVLSACAAQLVSLDATDLLCSENEPILENFPNLKHLKYRARRQGYFFQEPETKHLKFPVGIEHISFLELSYSNTNLIQLLSFIGRFEKTLSSLYLEFLGDPKKHGLALKRSEEMNSIFLRLSFPNVYTFGIFYPKCSKQWGVVRRFLGMFPNLRKLQFYNVKEITRGFNGTEEINAENETPTATSKGHLLRRVQSLCVNLERVVVYEDKHTWFLL